MKEAFYPISPPAAYSKAMLGEVPPEQAEAWLKERKKDRGWEQFIAALAAPDSPYRVHPYVQPAVDQWQNERIYMAVVGSREYERHGEVSLGILAAHTWLLKRGYRLVIVSGGARGVDRVAARSAQKLGIPCMEFIPDWNTYGKRAGILRNEQIIRHSQITMAFYDGKSRGTAHSMRLSADFSHPLLVIGPEVINCEPNTVKWLENVVFEQLRLENRPAIETGALKTPLNPDDINDWFFN